MVVPVRSAGTYTHSPGGPAGGVGGVGQTTRTNEAFEETSFTPTADSDEVDALFGSEDLEMVEVPGVWEEGGEGAGGKEVLSGVPADLEGEYRFGITEEMVAPYKNNPAVMAAISYATASAAEVNAARVAKAIRAFGRWERDTGSPEVQIAVLSEKIKYMTRHLRLHKKDAHSRKGLQAMLNKRRKLLNYLKRTSLVRYNDTVSRLGIRV